MVPLLFSCQSPPGGGNIQGTVSLGSSIQSPSSPSPRTAPAEPEAVPGELIVKLRSHSSTGLPQTLQVAGLRLSLLQPLGLPGVGVYRITDQISLQSFQDVQALDALAGAVARLPGVEYAHPNYILRAFRTPDDAFYSFQWSLDADHLDLPAAWNIEDGASPRVVVAVIDTGGLYRKNHPDLTPNQLPGYDFISDPSIAGDGNGRDPDAEDEGGESGYHGAHVAGTVAAVTDNGEGIAGVSWGAQVTHMRVLGINGSGSSADIIDSLLWAAGIAVPGVPNNPNPAAVINMSLGGRRPCSQIPAYQEAINRVNQQPQKPIIVVAAGNSQENASDYVPASCQGVITVGATEFRNYRAFYSNYGPRIDVMAPGGDTTFPLNGIQIGGGILSTVWDEFGTPPGPGYTFYQGTSMAAPHVAGVAALLKARNPNLGYAEVLNILKSTAQPLSDAACTGSPHPEVSVNLEGTDCGAGLIRPALALQAAGTGGPGLADFSLQISPSSLTLTPGQTAQVSVRILRSGGFNAAVSLSLVNPPPGFTGTFNPNPAADNSNLALSQGVSPGSYRLIVQGTSGSLTRQASLDITVSNTAPPPPPSSSISGTYVFSLFIDQDGNFDQNRSKFIRILRDGRSAAYTLENLETGNYLVVGWKDANQNNEVDDADLLNVYVDAQGNYLVRPPKSGVDFSLEPVQGLGRTPWSPDALRTWIDGVLRNR